MNPAQLRVAMAGLKAGDWAVSLAGAVLVAALAAICWRQGSAGRVLIRSAGKPFAELSLSIPQRIAVPGPLGVTEIEIRNGVVRVARDPGPRQLCVHQGWLTRAGQLAICLPNRVSIEVVGRDRSHDSLAY